MHIFKVYDKENLDDGEFKEVEALDAEEAAEVYLEDVENRQAEYCTSLDVEVEDPAGKRVRVHVYGETVLNYSAKVVEFLAEDKVKRIPPRRSYD